MSAFTHKAQHVFSVCEMIGRKGIQHLMLRDVLVNIYYMICVRILIHFLNLTLKTMMTEYHWDKVDSVSLSLFFSKPCQTDTEVTEVTVKLCVKHCLLNSELPALNPLIFFSGCQRKSFWQWEGRRSRSPGSWMRGTARSVSFFFFLHLILHLSHLVNA